MSVVLRALTQKWKSEAETLKGRYQQPGLANVFEVCARELEEAIRTEMDAIVTVAEAVRISGYSKSHLRRMIDGRRLPNYGEKGAPRLKLGDLPFRAGRAAPTGAFNAVQRAAGRASARGTVRPVG